MRAEISYDLAMDDGMAFVEGTFRLPGGDWQVVIFSANERDIPEPVVVPQIWESGVSGLFIRFPRHERLNQESAERVLSMTLGVVEWVRVRGPDSMILR